MSYNGWANWETWNVNLWMMDEGHYPDVVFDGLPFTQESARQLVREAFPNGTPDMNSAQEYAEVDWEHIADAWNAYDGTHILFPN